MSDEKNTPIWKKEISFRRKPDEGTAESDPGSASLWKKEISFGKKAKEADADGVSAADADVMVEPEAPLEGAPTVDLDLIAKYAPLPEPVAPPPPAGAGRQAPIQPAPIEHDWLTKPLEEVSEPPEEPLALVPDLLPEAPPSPISLVPAVEEAAAPSDISLEPVSSVELVAAARSRSSPPELAPAPEPRPRPRAPPAIVVPELPPAIVAPELPPAAVAPAPAIAALPELPPSRTRMFLRP